MTRGFEYRFRPPLAHPSDKGAEPPAYRRKMLPGGILYERDVAVELPDGATMHVDVFRPGEGPAAPLIGWGPYGKHGHTRYAVNFPKADVDDSRLSPWTAFEAPDPGWWVPRGYAVINPDPRGTWYSEGRATYLSPEEAADFAALIEWAGTRDWSTGRVGLSGVSYLTSAQWRVAELDPPYLAAINPWEGWSDLYREVVRHGGIPETSFWPYLPGRWGHSTTEIEDLRLETAEREFLDAYWESKRAKLERIRVPAFVCASWTDQGLHTRGTLVGFRRIASEDKWLYVHGRKKWAHYYEPRSMELQRAFFDEFLRRRQGRIAGWPKVRFELRDRIGEGQEYAAENWPIEGTRYAPLHLTPDGLSPEPPAAAAEVSFDAADGGQATFDHRFADETALVGGMALKLWVSTDAGSDIDLFVAVQKLDAAGAVVPFAYYAQFEDGPVALGWLRASHRELAPEATAERPVLAHRRALPVTPGEPVEVEIEIWPSGTRFAAGESLRLVIAGRDIYDYPRPSVYARHEALRNEGHVTLHLGPGRTARLLVPVVGMAGRMAV